MMPRCLPSVFAIVAASLASAGTGCLESNPAAEDGGPPGLHDSGTPDSEDASDGAPSCVVGEFVRCTDECEQRCPAGQFCSPSIGLCLPGRGALRCAFLESSDHDGVAPTACADGSACWVSSADPFDGERGVCVPTDLCLIEDEALGPHHCTWSDGSRVATDPPTPDPCPEPVVDDWGTRTCGSEACAGGVFLCEPFGSSYGACVGRNGDRGFGICALIGHTVCNPGALDLEALAICDEAFREPCACMAQTPTTFGHWVSQAACQRYAEYFPDGIDCVR